MPASTAILPRSASHSRDLNAGKTAVSVPLAQKLTRAPRVLSPKEFSAEFTEGTGVPTTSRSIARRCTRSPRSPEAQSLFYLAEAAGHR